jgi:soluble P-type ATPase
MIELDTPGLGPLQIPHLVMEYNGSLAVDGVLLDGQATLLTTLADRLDLHVITADTFGQAGGANLPVCHVH